MTRDEQRTACADAIRSCMGWEDSPGKWLAAFIILDSLHGLARVVPLVATEEMIEALLDDLWTQDEVEAALNDYRLGIVKRWRAMSAKGDLTNPPETQ